MKPGNLSKYYSDYLEGELDEAAMRRFEAILRDSPELQADYELFVTAHRMVTRMPVEAVDGGFEAEVLAKMDRVGQVAARRRLADYLPSWGYLATATAASLLVGIFLAYFLHRGAGGDPAGAALTRGPGDRAMAGAAGVPASPLQEKRQLHVQIGEISELVEEINRLNERFQLDDKEIVLGYAGDQELVLRPSEFYRRALQAADRDRPSDDSVRHAF